MKELKHNDFVRLKDWHLTEFGKMGTAKGYAAESRNATPEEIQEAEDRAIERGHEIAWINFSGRTLVGGDGGAYYRDQEAKGRSAIELEDGEVILVEDRRYTVKVVKGNHKSPQNSDPIHLIPVDGPIPENGYKFPNDFY